ncbi:hypothetical protein G3M74_10660 [Paenibacillus polymyxa]|nr:hypothetical protein [Paenibacillus polymyxa]
MMRSFVKRGARSSIALHFIISNRRRTIRHNGFAAVEKNQNNKQDVLTFIHSQRLSYLSNLDHGELEVM